MCVGPAQPPAVLPPPPTPAPAATAKLSLRLGTTADNGVEAGARGRVRGINDLRIGSSPYLPTSE